MQQTKQMKTCFYHLNSLLIKRLHVFGHLFRYRLPLSLQKNACEYTGGQKDGRKEDAGKEDGGTLISGHSCPPVPASPLLPSPCPLARRERVRVWASSPPLPFSLSPRPLPPSPVLHFRFRFLYLFRISAFGFRISFFALECTSIHAAAGARARRNIPRPDGRNGRAHAEAPEAQSKIEREGELSHVSPRRPWVHGARGEG